MRRGAAVDVVEAYRSTAPPDLAARAAAIFTGTDAGKPGWITFTSSSTVENVVAAAGAQALEGVRIASIGPITTATLKKNGFKPCVEASVFTVEGLIDAILKAGIIGL
jgi:uroporphyrinogen III methyltransferase / synthase